VSIKVVKNRAMARDILQGNGNPAAIRSCIRSELT